MLFSTRSRATQKPRVLINDGFGTHESLEVKIFCFGIGICRDALDGSDKDSLDSSAPAIPEIFFTYQNFERAQNTQQDACLVHIIDIFWNNSRIVELLTYHGEPLHHLIVDVVIVSCPVASGSQCVCSITGQEVAQLLAFGEKIASLERHLSEVSTLKSDHTIRGRFEFPSETG